MGASDPIVFYHYKEYINKHLLENINSTDICKKMRGSACNIHM
jgi:hypothetical protein